MDLAKNFELDGSSTMAEWDSFTKEIEKVIEMPDGTKINLWEKLFGTDLISTDENGGKHFNLAKFTALDPEI